MLSLVNNSTNLLLRLYLCPQEEVQRGSLHRKDVREVRLQPVGHLRLLGDLQRQVEDPPAVNLHPQEGLQVGNHQLPRRGQVYPL